MAHPSSVRCETEYRKEESPFGRFTFVPIARTDNSASLCQQLVDLQDSRTYARRVRSQSRSRFRLFSSRQFLDTCSNRDRERASRIDFEGGIIAIPIRACALARSSLRTRPEINVGTDALRLGSRLAFSLSLSLAPL